MRKRTNPKPTIDDICMISKEPYAEMHEVFFGNPNARLSQDYKMQIRLSGHWHRDNKQGIHHNKAFRKVIQHIYQLKFDDWHPDKNFFNIFRENFLLTQEEFGQYMKQLPFEACILIQIMDLNLEDIH